MYGTVAHLRIKKGMEKRFADVLKEYEQLKMPGGVASYVYKMDKSANDYYLCAVFEDREKYRANANSPEQDKRYRKLAELLEREPEWHDGEIIQAVSYAVA